jgi:hypothetical protein
VTVKFCNEQDDRSGSVSSCHTRTAASYCCCHGGGGGLDFPTWRFSSSQKEPGVRKGGISHVTLTIIGLEQSFKFYVEAVGLDFYTSTTASSQEPPRSPVQGMPSFSAFRHLPASKCEGSGASA